MKNLTIALDDELHRKSRVRAAEAGMSMSRYFASLVERDMAANSAQSDDERERRLKLLEAFLSGPKLEISENGRMPNAEERNARR